MILNPLSNCGLVAFTWIPRSFVSPCAECTNVFSITEVKELRKQIGALDRSICDGESWLTLSTD